MRSLSLAAAGVLALSSLSQAAVITGSLTSTDPRFNRPQSATATSTNTAVAYDTYSLTADLAGPYSIQGFFEAPLDGYLVLYSSFNPATPLAGLLAGDDDEALNGNSAARGAAIPGAGNYGPATNNTTLTLVPGVTYTLVVTAFANATATSGSGLGNYTITTNALSVPEPTGLAVIGLGAAAMLRRRR